MRRSYQMKFHTRIFLQLFDITLIRVIFLPKLLLLFLMIPISIQFFRNARFKKFLSKPDFLNEFEKSFQSF